MKITNNKVVTMDYTLKDDKGTVLDTSIGKKALSYVQGIGSIIPGLEKACDGKTAGDKFSVSISPEEAYGQYDSSLIFDVSRTEFENANDLAIGMQFQVQTENGVQVLTILSIEGDQVKLDGNHPLAGITLHFDVSINDVRDATAEEIEHGHVH